MRRPHFHKGIADLRRFFETHRDDARALRELRSELQARSRPRARNLLREVQDRLDRIEDEDGAETITIGRDLFDSGAEVESHAEFRTERERDEPTPDDEVCPDRLNKIRPPGTAGLPEAYVRPLSREISLPVSPGSDLPDLYVAALTELIREMRRSGTGQKKYPLERGIRSEVVGEDTLYVFPFPNEAELFEDARIEISVEQRRVEGTVVSIEVGKLILALRENLGKEVSGAILLLDSTALLEALQKSIQRVRAGEVTLNRTLADAVVGAKSIPDAPRDAIASRPSDALDRHQINAYERALTNSITFIWGPPGCGKTRTLGEIVHAAFEDGKRILITSNTNKAVDQVLYRICQTLGRQHSAMKEGRIFRMGRVAYDKLEDEYRDYVTVEGIAERRSAELTAKKQRLESEIAQIDSHSQQTRAALSLFDALDQAELQISEEQERLRSADSALASLRQRLADNQHRKAALLDELKRRNEALLKLFNRSERSILEDIDRNATERRDVESKFHDAEHARESAIAGGAHAKEQRDRLKSTNSGFDRARLGVLLTAIVERRASLVSRLREVVNQIASIEGEILRSARVIGATSTKVHLSQKEIGTVDLVIVDEASMVLLPAIWFATGLSKERVVVSGDFRQIPPIVTTQQEAIFDVLGTDVFKAAKMNSPNDDARGHRPMLQTQYRMHSKICDLIAQPMYEGRLHTAPACRSTDSGPTPPPFDGVLTIIDTSDLWPFESQNVFYSRFNLMHALLARNLAWHFHRAGAISTNDDLGICTPYAAQSRIIQKLLEGEGLGRLVPVGTVHRYQGDERRTILLDILESHGGARALGHFVQGVPPEHIGARLMNVAVSRAQEHLIVLANLTYLDKRLPSASLLRSILFEMQENGRVVPGRDVLALRPIHDDLAGLVGKMPFDGVVESLGIFDEAQFERALTHDIQAAQKSVVIFSGYVTPARVGKLSDLLRYKIASGVKVRCITRPSSHNGSIPREQGQEAIEMLGNIGAVVDLRARIHQKICLIDNRIVWSGSLNALSHTGRSDETMIRAVNEGFATLIAANMSKRPISANHASATVADAENPHCPTCGGRTVLFDGRYGPYFKCEACGWKQSTRQETRTAGRRRSRS